MYSSCTHHVLNVALGSRLTRYRPVRPTLYRTAGPSLKTIRAGRVVSSSSVVVCPVSVSSPSCHVHGHVASRHSSGSRVTSVCVSLTGDVTADTFAYAARYGLYCLYVTLCMYMSPLSCTFSAELCVSARNRTLTITHRRTAHRRRQGHSLTVGVVAAAAAVALARCPRSEAGHPRVQQLTQRARW